MLSFLSMKKYLLGLELKLPEKAFVLPDSLVVKGAF